MIRREYIACEQANYVVTEHVVTKPKPKAVLFLSAKNIPHLGLAILGPYKDKVAAEEAVARYGLSIDAFNILYVGNDEGSQDNPNYADMMDKWTEEHEHILNTYAPYYDDATALAMQRMPDLENIARSRVEHFEYLIRNGEADELYPVIYWGSPHVVAKKDNAFYLVVRLKAFRKTYLAKLTDPEEARIV